MKRLILLAMFWQCFAGSMTNQAEPGFIYAVGKFPTQDGQIFVYDPTTYLLIGPTGMTVPGWYMTAYSTNLTDWRFLQTEPFDVPGYKNRSSNQVFTAGIPVHDTKLPTVFVRLLYSKERRTSPYSISVMPAKDAK